MKSILHRDFKYVPAARTDISKTFAKERKRIAEEKAATEAVKQEAERKVRRLK